jgi:hypothetical protein
VCTSALAWDIALSWALPSRNFWLGAIITGYLAVSRAGLKGQQDRAGQRVLSCEAISVVSGEDG